MDGEGMWNVKKTENYELKKHKNTVSAINLTFWHRNETCEIQTCKIHFARCFSTFIFPLFYSAAMRARNIFSDA